MTTDVENTSAADLGTPVTWGERLGQQPLSTRPVD